MGADDLNEINRCEIAKGVNFTTVKDNRFKTIKISATMLVPLQADTASANSLLIQVLARSCKKYPEYMQLNRKLSELYGATLSAYSRKIGDNLALTISISGIDDRFSLTGDSISKELVNLLCNLIFGPKIIDNALCQQDVEQERRQMLDMIDSEFNEKRIFAINRLIEIMCKDEPFGIKRYGTKEQTEKVTKQQLYSAWQNLLKTAKIELIMLGNSDSTIAKEEFTKAFALIDRTTIDLKTIVIPKAITVTEHTDKMEVSQSKLVLGFRTQIAEPDENEPVARLMNAVLGATPHSKLFLNVREKYSLCYYCLSSYYRNKGILLVECGVEKENIEKAKAEILNQIEEIKNGNISAEEISSTKLSIANSFNSMYDTIAGMESWYVSQMMDKDLLSPSQSVAKINSVTKEQIVNAANKLTLDTVYVLTSKD